MFSLVTPMVLKGETLAKVQSKVSNCPAPGYLIRQANMGAVYSSRKSVVQYQLCLLAPLMWIANRSSLSVYTMMLTRYLKGQLTLHSFSSCLLQSFENDLIF